MNIHNLNENFIVKAIVFDFDETMYSSPTQNDAYVRYIFNAILNLSNYTENQAKKIIEDFGFDKVGQARVSFGKNCEKFGIKQSAWNEYKIDNFFEVDYDNAIIVPNNLYFELSQKMPIFIVSNEIKENLVYKANKLGIDLSPFKDIYAPTKANPSMIEKKDMMLQIINNLKIEKNNLLAIGDRYNVDIKPCEELGGAGIEVSGSQEVEKIIKYILNERLKDLKED